MRIAPCCDIAIVSGDGTNGAGAGLTIVVGLRKGLIAVGPPRLVHGGENTGTPSIDDTFTQIREPFQLNAITISIAGILGGLIIIALVGLWWTAGRDRWFGDMYYIRENPPEGRKPVFARETIVVEYQPPDVGKGRRLRPAEIGVLMDERADTLDVGATIIDLTVRGTSRSRSCRKSEFSAYSRARTMSWCALTNRRAATRWMDCCPMRPG